MEARRALFDSQRRNAHARSVWWWDVDPEPSSSRDARRLLPRDLAQTDAAGKRPRQSPVEPLLHPALRPRRAPRGGRGALRLSSGGVSAVLAASSVARVQSTPRSLRPCQIPPIRSPEESRSWRCGALLAQLCVVNSFRKDSARAGSPVAFNFAAPSPELSAWTQASWSPVRVAVASGASRYSILVRPWSLTKV